MYVYVYISSKVFPHCQTHSALLETFPLGTSSSSKSLVFCRPEATGQQRADEAAEVVSGSSSLTIGLKADAHEGFKPFSLLYKAGKSMSPVPSLSLVVQPYTIHGMW